MYVLYFLQTEEQWDVTIFRKISYQFKQVRCVDANNILEPIFVHLYIINRGIPLLHNNRGSDPVLGRKKWLEELGAMNNEHQSSISVPG